MNRISKIMKLIFVLVDDHSIFYEHFKTGMPFRTCNDDSGLYIYYLTSRMEEKKGELPNH